MGRLNATSFRRGSMAVVLRSQRIRRQPDQQCPQVPDRGETRPHEQRDDTDGGRHYRVCRSPSRRDAVCEHTGDSDEEVAHSDVACIDEPWRGEPLLDAPAQITLAEVAGDHVWEMNPTDTDRSVPSQRSVGARNTINSSR